MTQPIKIAYILSVGHSGSSLLDVLLGQDKNAVSIGEVKLDSEGRVFNSVCTCGSDLKDCLFWKQVNERFGGDQNSVFNIKFTGRLSEVDYQDIVRFYQAIRSVSGATLIVDSSKSIARLRALHEIRDHIDLKVVFLERIPQGVIASNFRKGRSWFLHTLTYLLNNTSKRHFARQYPYLHVTYEELAGNPQRTTAMIYDFLDFSPGQAESAQSDLSSSKHMLGGNTMLYKPIAEIKRDDRWQTELSGFQKSLIGFVCHPFLQRIVYSVVSLKRSFNKTSPRYIEKY